jgi:hypothetical protein
VSLHTAAGGGTDSYVSTTNTCTSGSWCFFTAVLTSATNREIYLNGNVTGKGVDSVSRNPSNLNEFNIGFLGGEWWDDYPNYFNGVIDEIMIFNRTLSVSEIQQLTCPTCAKSLIQQLHGIFMFNAEYRMRLKGLT